LIGERLVPPSPTDLLNKEIDRLADAINKLTSKVDEEVKASHDFAIRVTDRLGQIDTKIGRTNAIMLVAGTLAMTILSSAFYVSRNMYQTVFLEGKEVGALKAKLDMIDIRFNEHIKNAVQPTRYVPPPMEMPAPDPKIPSYVPAPSETPSELDKIEPLPKSKIVKPKPAPDAGTEKPKS
jgi:hypothetical protein